MNHDLMNDSEPVPGPPLPGISSVRYDQVHRWLAVLVGLAGLVAVGWYSVNVYADYLWHAQLGYGLVFLYFTVIRTSLFLIGGMLAATLLAMNFAVLLPLALGPLSRPLPVDFLRLCLLLLRLFIYAALISSGLAFGSLAHDSWPHLILLLHQAPFGIADPHFGRDATFYVINLPVLRAAQAWLLSLSLTVIVISAFLYGAIYLLRGLNFVLTPRALRHLAGLGAILLLSLAAHHVLSIYELVLSQTGPDSVVTAGATYTDVHARIPVYWFLAAIATLAAAGFVASIRPSPTTGLRLMAGSFTLWLLMFLLAGLLYPALFQRLRVSPDEFAREQPYLQRNIDATRAAYGLDAVESVVYPVNESLTEETLLASGQHIGAAMENIRLWDAAPLLAAYNQLQFMELYYNFVNTDSDRYMVDGQLQQVLIGARELDQERLPDDAQNWVNQRLQYTHGYGVSMTPATGFTPGEGRPEYFIQDIPIKGALPVSRPEVYYGESPAEFAIVSSGMREINPSGFQPGSEGWNYDGDGGVALDSYFRRLLYAVKFGDVNIALSSQVAARGQNGVPRIQFRRHVRERVKTIAPFLKLDEDPYPVLDDAGKLWWIQDAYTVTDNYPYSTRLDTGPVTSNQGGFNYIRNSVKAVVDAYHGDVTLYVMDPDDPILSIYRNAFPVLFQPFAEMPDDLKAHIRYPVTLFSAQARMYLRYHVTDPHVFFNQAEQWDIPLETRLGKDGVRVTPAYLLMPLPGEDQAEFILQIPFSPAGQKKNLVGLLVARNDPPHYGQLRSYHLPDDRQIDGPSQVEARIENDQDFSQLFTLWQGAGSEIIRGRLLAIPIADTIVYVEPLYLQSEFLEFPELKKVILADNTNLVMADSMAEAVARLTGAPQCCIGAAHPEPVEGRPVEPGTISAEQLEQINDIEATISELGKALEDLEKSLQNLRKTLER